MELPGGLPIRRDGGAVEILDQTRLPAEELRLRVTDLDGLCEAIRSLRIRGAPLLGLAGAYGLALAAATRGAGDDALRRAAEALRATRPTAADLGHAIDAALDVALAEPNQRGRAELLWESGLRMHEQQFAIDRAIGAYGAALLPEAASVLTHCNTGMLATGALGTAFAVIATAHEQGKLATCYADETRPLLQGGRLTAWELELWGIPYALLVDGAAASLIASGAVSAVITGADRIARNGDTANKVGTLGLALACRHYGVPFYIAAPLTTFDPQLDSGSEIPIEHRAASEVRGFRGLEWAPAGAGAYNPAFDVTPSALISAIITEYGVLTPPYSGAIDALTHEEVASARSS